MDRRGLRYLEGQAYDGGVGNALRPDWPDLVRPIVGVCRCPLMLGVGFVLPETANLIEEQQTTIVRRHALGKRSADQFIFALAHQTAEDRIRVGEVQSMTIHYANW